MRKCRKSNLIWFFLTDESFGGSVQMWLTKREVVFLFLTCENFGWKFCTLKNKYNLTLSQSRLHTASKTFVSPKKFRLKGIVHPKMKILSSFAHPQVVPNLNECICSAEHKGRYSEECEKQSSSEAPLTSIVLCFPTMEVNGAPKQPGYKLSSKYLPLCSAEQRNSYRFGTTGSYNLP